MADPNQRTNLSFSDLAKQYRVSSPAVEALICAIRAGGCGQALFSHLPIVRASKMIPLYRVI